MGFSALIDGLFSFAALFEPDGPPTKQKPFKPVFVERPNTIVTGASQIAGKTTSIIAYDAVPCAEADDCFIFFGDPHGSGGLTFAGHVHEMGMEDRLLMIDLTRSIYCGWGMFFRSRNPDPHECEKENQSFARMAAEALSGHRSGSIDDTRLIKEWLMAVIALLQYQRTDVSWNMLRCAFYPGTLGFNMLLAGCTNDRVKAKFESLLGMRQNLYAVIGPTARLLEETLDWPAFAEMMVQTFDLEAYVRQKKIIVILGSGEEAFDRIIIRMMVLRLIQIAMKNWALTKTPLPMRIFEDEASKLIGETEANAAGKTLKMGLSFCWISQTQDFGDPLINTRVEENCSRKIMMHAGSGVVAALNAKHLTLNLNAYKPHHTTERQVVDGYEEVETESTDESRDDEGRVRKGKRKGKSLRAKHRTVEDVHYQNLSDQESLNLRALMELDTGWAFIREGKTLEGPLLLPMLTPPYGDIEEAQERIDELIEKQLQQGIFRRPAPPSTLCLTTKPPPPKPANGQPKKKRTKGMRRS